MRVYNSASLEGIIRISLIFYNMNVYCVFSLEYTVFNINKENHTKLSQSVAKGFFPGTHKQVRNSRGKRAISVRTTEVLLYL